MFRTIVLGLATVATIAAVTVAAAVIGTAAATYAIDKATLRVTVTTATPATPQWPARYVGRFVGLS
jgi:polyisoprenoid-binding protein YceI